MLEGNHQGFLKNGAPHFLQIEENAIFSLKAHPHEDLNWTIPECSFWDIDLGLNSGMLSLKDPAFFFSLSLALEKFTQEIWPSFQEKTVGLSLYQGPFDIADRLIWDAEMEEHLLEKFPEVNATSRLFFAADLFAEFLHRLASFLPVELPLFCFFDVKTIPSFAHQAALFNPTRFEHLHLALKHSPLPFRGLAWKEGGSFGGHVGEKLISQAPRARKIGLVVPHDQELLGGYAQKFDALIEQALIQNVPFRLVPEQLLTAEWDGLDALLILPDAISKQGKRMLQGFTATGGQIITTL